MLKFSTIAKTAIAVAMLPIALQIPFANAAIGPQAAICEKGGLAVIAQVKGLKTRGGVIRVQLYVANPNSFLEKKQYLQRIDVPVTRSGIMDICVPVPKAGRYVLSVRHDVDGNGKSGMSDGGGFSGNPKMSLGDLLAKRKPDLGTVAFAVGAEQRTVPIVLNYVQGFSFKPIS